MANNLIHLIKNQLSDNLMGKVASLVGANRSLAGSAMSSFLPSVIKGLVSKGSTLAGAKSILSLMKDNNIGKTNLNDAFSGGDASKSFMDMGSKLTSSVFGNDQSSVLRNLATKTGLSSDAASSMMNIATPTALHSLSQVVSKENMSAEDLQSYLRKQTVTETTRGTATETTTRRTETSTANTARTVEETNTGGGMGWLKWLLPLLLLCGLGWFLTRGGDTTTTTDTTAKTERKAVPVSGAKTRDQKGHEGHNHAAGDHSGHNHAAGDHSGHNHAAGDGHNHNHSGAASGGGYSVNAQGNLVDGSGKVVASKGEFSTKDGEYLDKDGKKIGVIKKIGKAIGDAAGKVGDAAGKVGGAVGDAAGKAGAAVGGAAGAVGGAVAGAAGKTADAFKSVFGGMFSKKEASVGAMHEMSKITFDPSNHRITNFSKNEVEGLAQALKAYPGSKIQVQVHAAQSSKERAQVVHDMLVTLGVSDKQISFKGMGDKDAAKAAAGKVEIMVEGN